MAYYFARIIEASFPEAIARTKAALSAHGFGVLSEIDVAATLKAKVNADMPPYLILGACNPQFAHRALQVEPKVGTMLPCNVIVREEAPGRIEIAAVDPVASMQAVDSPLLSEIAGSVRASLQKVVADL
ncbi:MAG: hypothetical protein DCF16_16985 [Alphaproteobacteria bacterium]|nr:MAG: hypothetical protein DCF16_16985 [Alphaproteobacteria bacterium]